MIASEVQQSELKIKPKRFKWIYEKIHSVFTPSKTSLLDDEAKELMQSALAQKSWFDKMTSGWVGQPFWIKALFVTGVTLIAGAIGILFNTSLLLMSLVGVAALGIHILFAQHESQRQKGARIITLETVALNKDLKAQRQLFNNGLEVVNRAADELQAQAQQMKSNAEIFNEYAKQIDQKNKVLDERVVVVTQVIEDLVDAKNNAQERASETTAALHTLTESIGQATQRVDKLGEASSQLADAVQGIETSQQSYAAMVERFSELVQERSERVAESTIPRSESFDLFMKEIMDETAANDTLIATMQK